MKMNTKYLAVAVVAILVVAGAATALVLAGDDDKDVPLGSNNLDGRLTIFGNANNDDYLDSRDVDFVKAIIAGEEDAVYYDCYRVYQGTTVSRSFADANCDGKIDEADVTWIQNMADRKENMLVYFYDVDGVISSCTYPLDTMAIGYKSNYEAVLICGAADRCLYACNQVSDNGAYAKWYTAFSDAKSIGSRFNPDYEVFLKEGNEKPDFFLSGTRAWFDPNMEETCGPIGVDVVRLPYWEDNICVSSVITLGYLIQCEDAAYKYAELVDSVLKTVQDAVSDIPVEERPLVFASYNGTNIAAMHSGIQEAVIAAGGRTPLQAGYSSGKIDGEGIYAMNPNFILLDHSGPYYGFLETYTTLEETKEKMYTDLTESDGKYIKVIDHTTAYREGNVLFFGQGTYMGPASYVTIAYIANALYPNLFDFDVDSLFNDYVETYHPEFSAADYAGLQYFNLDDLNAYFA